MTNQQSTFNNQQFAALIALMAIVSFGAWSAEVNIVKNSGFEDGDKHPAHWDRLDGLTMFWEKDTTRPDGGKCIRIYTNISNEEFLARYDEMKLENPPPPKPPRTIKGIGYDTVGGNDGVHYFSEYIEVKPGMRYTLSADVRSDSGGAPKIFIKGYTEQMTEIADDKGKAITVPLRRITYKGDFDFDAPKKWRNTTANFCPTFQRDDVKWIKVSIWPYWPPQNYFFDNVKVIESGMDAEAPKRWAKKRQSAKDNVAKELNEKVRETRAALNYVRKGLDQYIADIGVPPKKLEDLLKDPGVPKWNGPYVIELGEDAWERGWKYAAEGKEYRLKSLGADGLDDSGDEIE